MFSYLSLDDQSTLLQLNLESFINELNSNEEGSVKKLFDSANTELQKIASNDNFWRDLTIHFFQLPQPYYLGSEASFCYFYSVKDKIKDFYDLKDINHKLDLIDELSETTEHRYLAVCFSLSLIEHYRAAGHLVCVSTYEKLFKQGSAEEKNLFAVQVYFHALMLKKTFKHSKINFKQLGWKHEFSEQYTSPKRFVAMMYGAIRHALTDDSKLFAEALAA